MLKKRHAKKLLEEQDLEEEDMEDLDFANETLADLKFRGKCLLCPEAINAIELN